MKEYLAQISLGHATPNELPTQIIVRQFLASGLHPIPKDYSFNACGVTVAYSLQAKSILDARRDADQIGIDLQARLAKHLSQPVKLRTVAAELANLEDACVKQPLHPYTVTLADGLKLRISAAAHYIDGQEVVFLDTDCHYLMGGG